MNLVLDRTQMFGPVGHRPYTEQDLLLTARAEGRLTLRHAVVNETSLVEDWTEPSAIVSRMRYNSGALEASHGLVRMNIATPTFTRAPGEASGNFALEVAMDELAEALTLQLRLANHADRDPGKGKPFSSRSLRARCSLGAERFGW